MAITYCNEKLIRSISFQGNPEVFWKYEPVKKTRCCTVVQIRRESQRDCREIKISIRYLISLHRIDSSAHLIEYRGLSDTVLYLLSIAPDGLLLSFSWYARAHQGMDLDRIILVQGTERKL